MKYIDIETILDQVEKRYYYGQPILTVNYDVIQHESEGKMLYDYTRVELPPYVWSYGELVSAMIREEYSESEMEALTNNYLSNQGDMDAMTKYTEMQRYRGHCKAVARDLLRYSVDNNLASAEFIAEFDALENTRAKKLQEIANYDMSDAVNEFYLNGQGLWMTKAMRESMLTSLDMFTKAGETMFPFVLGNVAMELPCALLEQMLAAVEVYATRCMMVTAQHSSSVRALETEEAIGAYDYTTGYPEKPSFNTNG